MTSNSCLIRGVSFGPNTIAGNDRALSVDVVFMI